MLPVITSLLEIVQLASAGHLLSVKNFKLFYKRVFLFRIKVAEHKQGFKTVCNTVF